MRRMVYSALSVGLAAMLVFLACTRPDRTSTLSVSGGAGLTADEATLEKLLGEDESFPDIPRTTIQELASRLDDPDTMVIDVRPLEQWMISDRKIRGAIRQNPETIESWAGAYPKDKTLVLYCA